MNIGHFLIKEVQLGQNSYPILAEVISMENKSNSTNLASYMQITNWIQLYIDDYRKAEGQTDLLSLWL